MVNTIKSEVFKIVYCFQQAIVLTEYLERQVSAGRLVMKDKKIIELGAGTGLVSMASAIFGKLIWWKAAKISWAYWWYFFAE